MILMITVYRSVAVSVDVSVCFRSAASAAVSASFSSASKDPLVFKAEKKPKPLPSFLNNMKRRENNPREPSDTAYNFYTTQFQKSAFDLLGFFFKRFKEYLRLLNSMINFCKFEEKLGGRLIYAECHFKESAFPPCTQIEILSLAVFKLLIQYVYHFEPKSGYFTIVCHMRKGLPDPTREDQFKTFTITPENGSLNLCNPNGKVKPSFALFRKIILNFLILAEKYEFDLTGIQYLMVRAICSPNPETVDKPIHTDEEVDLILIRLFKSKAFLSDDGDLLPVHHLASGKAKSKYITALKPKKAGGKQAPFIVADLETIMFPEAGMIKFESLIKESPQLKREERTHLDEIVTLEIEPTQPHDETSLEEGDDGLDFTMEPSKDEKSIVMVHVPCAAGFAVVYPEDTVLNIPLERFETWYSEDYLEKYPSFLIRSEVMMRDYLNRISEVAFSLKIKTVYFHNLSGFDGYMIQRSYCDILELFSTKKLGALSRNTRLYKLIVECIEDSKKRHNFLDSVLLLPGSLKKLGRTMCPELGDKGEMPTNWNVNDLQQKSVREHLLNYMTQDIRLLAGIMKASQDRFFNEYSIDITNVLTISALAMEVFRRKYLDDKEFKMYIPTRNEDKFLREGYYGGRTDVFIPYGENLWFLDVTSLYPFIMMTCDMPEGKPVWVKSFDKDLDFDIHFGFVRAYIKCPEDMDRPFLPYRDGNILKFPTGEWVGNYLTEELKFAKKLGYTIVPMFGYLYKKRPSPFKQFITELFELRKKAKANKDEIMSFFYKTLMNSLYGRLGMNPQSTVTVNCTPAECKDYIDKFLNPKTRTYHMISAEPIGRGNFYQVKYYINHAESKDWQQPKNTAVQMSAAITAYGRIHMYKAISRPTCLYSDTDSVVDSQPLPAEWCSETEIGLFKLEHRLEKGVFIAPKSYCCWPLDGGPVFFKQKGLAHKLVTPQWFLETYLKIRPRSPDDGATKKAKIFHKVENAFVKDHKSSLVKVMEYNISLEPGISNKREPVFNEAGRWVGTKPFCIKDLGPEEPYVLMVKARAELEDKQKITDLARERLEKERQAEREEFESLKIEVRELRARLTAAGISIDYEFAGEDNTEAEAKTETAESEVKTAAEVVETVSEVVETAAEVVETVAEVETVTEVETEAKVEVEVETETKPKAEVEVETEPKVVAEVEVKTEPKVESEPEVEPEVETETKVVAEVEVKTEPEVESEPKTETEVEVEDNNRVD